MKIIDLKVRDVAIPLTCQLRHNTGVHLGHFLRTILERVTDEGIIGLGEVGGGIHASVFFALTHSQTRSCVKQRTKPILKNNAHSS